MHVILEMIADAEKRNYFIYHKRTGFQITVKLRFQKKQQAGFSTQCIVKQQNLLPQGAAESKSTNLLTKQLDKLTNENSIHGY